MTHSHVRFILLLSAIVLLVAPTQAAAQVPTFDPLAYAESLVQTTKLAQTVEFMRQQLQTAQQTLQLTRDAYAGVRQLDPKRALQEGREYFLNQSGYNMAKGLYDDVVANGLEGGDGAGWHYRVPWGARQLLTADLRGGIAEEHGGLPDQNGSADEVPDHEYFADELFQVTTAFAPATAYDYRGAVSVADDLERIIANLETRAKAIALSRVHLPTAADGLLDEDLRRVDPNLRKRVVHQRLAARQRLIQANALVAESLGASPAAAQQIAAEAAAIAAENTAALRETAAQQLALDQLAHSKALDEEVARTKSLQSMTQQLQKRAKNAFRARNLTKNPFKEAITEPKKGGK